MLKNRTIIRILLLLLQYFTINLCASLFVNEEHRTNETIKYLQETGYSLGNSNSSKKDAKINEINIYRAVYNSGDFRRICSLPQIKSILFEKTTLPNLTEEEYNTCSKFALDSLSIVDVKMDTEAFCKITRAFHERRMGFDVVRSGLDDSMMPCIGKLRNLKTLMIGRDAKISKESFCETLTNLDNLNFLSVDATDLPKASLQCILGLPNLTKISLNNWNKATYDDRAALIKAYEKKYNRKIESNLVDDY